MRKVVSIDPNGFKDGEHASVLTHRQGTRDSGLSTEQDAVYAVYTRLSQSDESFEGFFAKTFGVCPECKRYDGRKNLGSTHVGYCLEHKTKWYAGENLVPDWKLETAEQRLANKLYLQGFSEVIPALQIAAVPEVRDTQKLNPRESRKASVLL